jgi:hypothetical protein
MSTHNQLIGHHQSINNRPYNNGINLFNQQFAPELCVAVAALVLTHTGVFVQCAVAKI